MTKKPTKTINNFGFPNHGIHKNLWCRYFWFHYDDLLMGSIASQINSFTVVYWTVYSDADQRKHQSAASLAFGRGIHRGPVNSPHKWPVTRKMFPFDDVIMFIESCHGSISMYMSKMITRVTTCSNHLWWCLSYVKITLQKQMLNKRFISNYT